MQFDLPLEIKRVIDPELTVPDPTLSLAEGALQPWRTGYSGYWRRLIAAVAETYGIDIDKPWQELTDDEREVFLTGTGTERHTIRSRSRSGRSG